MDANEIEIVGIRKDNGYHENPHEAVSHYGWVERDSRGAIISSDVTDRMTVVGWLEGMLGVKINAYVQRHTPRAYCYVNTSARGTRFLETKRDSTNRNNLLELPEC
jgi:hypothetical protein